MAMEETAKALLRAGDLLGDSIAKSANPEQYTKTSAVLRELREAVQERSTEGLLDQIVVAVAFYTKQLSHLVRQPICFFVRMISIWTCGRGSS